MSDTSRTLVIAGLGLMGGSLARALRKSGFCDRFVGYGPREPSLKRGVELGVIDSYTLDLEEALAQADLFVLCGPTLSAAELLEKVLPLMAASGSNTIVTDVASVKGNLHRAALEIHGAMPARLVLGHPIAGSERSGVEASSAELFAHHRVILTPVEGNDGDAVSTVSAMWESAGAEVVQMSVARHDAVLAATSHLPHMLAYSLVDALASDADSDEIFRCAAGGFRDFTRIASSDPTMWRDIALANRDAVLSAIDDFSHHLSCLREAVAAENGEQLFDTFTRAKTARDEFAAILSERGQQAKS